MPAAAQAAAGTTIAIDKLNTGVTYVVLSQVTAINGVDGGETGKADTTHLSSTRKTSRPTIPGETEVTFDLNFDPTDTDHTYVRDLRVSRVVHGWQVGFPQMTGTPKATFHGWVSNIDGINAGGIDENLTATVTISVTDDVVWT
jgi:hypothetical protein